MVRLAATVSFNVWISEAHQVYPQSEDPMSCLIDVKIFFHGSSSTLILLQQLYRLSEHGDMWFETPDHHHREEMLMETLGCEPPLYINMKDEKLVVYPSPTSMKSRA